MDSIIEDVQVRKILDSRGNPTVEVDVITWNGFGRAAAPSGASTGSREVVSFPEGGVDVIVSEVEEVLACELIGMDAEDIATIDEVLREVDGTDNLSAIGGNTTVAVSMAVSKAAAASYNMPLYKYLGGNLVNEMPFPLGNMMNGGAHAGINAPDIQTQVRALAEHDPLALLGGKPPLLVDEWQLAPDLWNVIRHEIDARQAPGQFILSGSVTPPDDPGRHSGAGRFARVRMRPMALGGEWTLVGASHSEKSWGRAGALGCQKSSGLQGPGGGGVPWWVARVVVHRYRHCS